TSRRSTMPPAQVCLEYCCCSARWRSRSGRYGAGLGLSAASADAVPRDARHVQVVLLHDPDVLGVRADHLAVDTEHDAPDEVYRRVDDRLRPVTPGVQHA